MTVLLFLSPAIAFSPNFLQFRGRVQGVMAMDHRTEAELARDADRDPVNAIDFVGWKRI